MHAEIFQRIVGVLRLNLPPYPGPSLSFFDFGRPPIAARSLKKDPVLAVRANGAGGKAGQTNSVRALPAVHRSGRKPEKGALIEKIDDGAGSAQKKGRGFLPADPANRSEDRNRAERYLDRAERALILRDMSFNAY